MLKKLIKHEFIAMARYFLPLYLFAVILTPVFSLIFRLGLDENAGPVTGIMSGLGITGFIFTMVALFIASSIFIVIRFYRTTATSEAYLTFTLPAKPGQILCSKLLVASIWQLASFVVALIAILGMLLISGIFTPAQMSHGISMLFNYIFHHNSVSSGTIVLTILSYLLIMLVGIPSGILLYYCSIMLGQLFNEHRVIASFGIYIAISTVMQIVSFIATIPISLLFDLGNGSSANALAYMNATMFLATGLNVVIGAGCYIATVMIMKKKLNVR